jgi:16S rRNA processing protein RimM
VRLLVARVGRAHGIRGEVSVEVRTDAPEHRFTPGAVLHVADGGRRTALAAAGRPTSVTVTRARQHKGRYLLSFAEVADRTAAEELRDAMLEADVDNDQDEPDAWYDHQLIGLRVVDRDGALLGEVVGVEHLPAQDLLVVRRGERDRLVPFVHAIVPEVDLPAGRVLVDAPPGLLDDPEPS